LLFVPVYAYNNLWIGTNSGLFKYNNVDGSIFKFDFYPLNTHITNISPSHDGHLWIACNEGVLRYNIINNSYKFHNLDIKADPYGEKINTIFEVKKDLLIGTGDEGLLLLKYDESSQSYSQLESIQIIPGTIESRKKLEIFDICKSRTGDIWLGTDNGLARIQDFNSSDQKVSVYKNNPASELSLCNNRVYRVFIDQTDVLWCGTENGLGKLDLSLLSINFYNFGMPNSSGEISTTPLS